VQKKRRNKDFGIKRFHFIYQYIQCDYYTCGTAPAGRDRSKCSEWMNNGPRFIVLLRSVMCLVHKHHATKAYEGTGGKRQRILKNYKQMSGQLDASATLTMGPCSSRSQRCGHENNTAIGKPGATSSLLCLQLYCGTSYTRIQEYHTRRNLITVHVRGCIQKFPD
jgi:hypothetical protein